MKGTVFYLLYMGRLHTNVKLSNRLDEPPAEGATVDYPDGCLTKIPSPNPVKSQESKKPKSV